MKLILTKEEQAFCANVHTMLEQMAHNAPPLIRDALQKLFVAPGKMTRPLLVFRAMQSIHLYGYESALVLAASIEALHSASLLHDDVLDNADTRRGETTIQIQMGNRRSILSGDFLFAEALLLVSTLGNATIVQKFSRCIQALCSGELLQDQLRREKIINVAQYKQVISLKTASVFRLAFEGPSLAMGIPAEKRETLATFGWNVGMAFQILDDLQNILQTHKDKPTLTDFADGIITLPLLLCWQSLPGPLQEAVYSGQPLLAQQSLQIVKHIQENKGDIQTAQAVLEYLEKAESCLPPGTRGLSDVVMDMRAFTQQISFESLKRIQGRDS